MRRRLLGIAVLLGLGAFVNVVVAVKSGTANHR